MRRIGDVVCNETDCVVLAAAAAAERVRGISDGDGRYMWVEGSRRLRQAPGGGGAGLLMSE